LGRKVSTREWTAIFFLLIGAICANIQPNDNIKFDQLVDRNTYLGLVSVGFCTLTSAFAGIWTEKVLKGSKIDLWVRNFQLGFFSIWGNLFIIWQHDYDFIVEHGFLGGYTWHTWVVIVVGAAGGILIAVTMKYMSTLAKAFGHAFAVIVGTVVAVILFDFTVGIYFVFAVIFVMYGIYLNMTRTLALKKGTFPFNCCDYNLL